VGYRSASLTASKNIALGNTATFFPRNDVHVFLRVCNLQGKSMLWDWEATGNGERRLAGRGKKEAVRVAWQLLP
jgi:hypothetical protein